MYADEAWGPGCPSFPQRNGSLQGQVCVQYEPLYQQLHHRAGPGYRPGPTQMDHPLLARWTDFQALSFRDLEAGPLPAARAGRGSRRLPQRRPVFAEPGPLRPEDGSNHSHPWDPRQDPRRSLEAGARHCSTVPGQCGYAVWGDPGTRPFHTEPTPPLPQPQFRGQGRQRRPARPVSEEEQCWECAAERYHANLLASHPQPGPAHIPNGHAGPRPGRAEGGDDRDSHQNRKPWRGGSEEHCNGPNAPHKAFFATEVPQKNLDKPRHHAPRVPPPKSPAPPAGTHHQGAEQVRLKKGKQDGVRDQIRRVVTDLEDVLGGLKQVHVEMKEVVEQIDRLTAHIDLTEGRPSIAAGGPRDSLAPLPQSSTSSGHMAPPNQLFPRQEEDRVILGTNSPSPIHMAAVVKTSRVVPPGHRRPLCDRPGMNGHPPHLFSSRDPKYRDHTQPEPVPPCLDPEVIVRNHTPTARTQKPPPYPHNGRCGKGPGQPPNSLKTAAYPGRGQSLSMV